MAGKTDEILGRVDVWSAKPKGAVVVDQLEWPSLILGAVLGVLVNKGFDKTEAWARIGERRGSRRKSRRIERSINQVGWDEVLEHYRSAGSFSELYRPGHVGHGGVTPLLVDESWIASLELDLYEATSLQIVDDKRREFGVDLRAIKKRQSEGVRLFDGEILFVEETRDQDGLPPQLRLGNCSYFSYASLALRLEREFRRRFRRRPLIDTYFRNAKDALARPAPGLALGCLCATVFMTAEGPEFVLHQRSDEVLSLGSLYSLTPMFGVEANRRGGRSSKRPLLQYNFAKEFAEEFYNLEDVVSAAMSKRFDIDWVFELNEMAGFETERTAGRLRLTYTGMCISPLEGVASIALLAVFDDPEAKERVLAGAEPNFESGELLFRHVDDPCLDGWADRRELGATSVFALDRARAVLASNSASATIEGT
jgi:hypothetical protein